MATLGFAAAPVSAAVDSTLTLTGTKYGSSVQGALPRNPSTAVDAAAGYPEDIPASGYRAVTGHGTALFTARGDVTSEALLYCIDINTGTSSGNDYELGTWGEADVRNPGYVARVLAGYYPNTGAPPAGSDSTRVAAVQSAIWFFSDGLVLAPTEPIRGLVEQIVAGALADGPLTEPAPPSVAISSPNTVVLLDEVAGPHTIQAEGTPVTVSATGGTMWRDAAGTDPIPDGTLLDHGTEIYLRAAAGSTSVTILATGTVVAQGGSALLYTKGINQAQKLILATDTEVTASATATQQFLAFGSLVIDKSIVGEGAGIQSDITLHVSGTNGLEDDFVIPAGSTGTVSKTYDRIPIGTTVTITEPGDGTFPGLTVDVTGLGTAVVEQEGETHVGITDDYATHFGAVRIVKSIEGSGAGLQDDVVLHISGTNGLEEDFVIPAGSTGETAKVYEGLPEGTVITVTETADGANGRTTCTVTEGDPATIATDRMVDVTYVNTYEEIVGSVEITKTINGTGAGLQGEVMLHVSGSNGLDREIRIPAGTTGETSVVIDGIPVGTEITVEEVFDGGNPRVTVTVSEWDTAIIAADQIVSIDVVNTYGKREGFLAQTGMSPLVLVAAAGVGALLLAGGGVAMTVTKRRNR